VAGQWAGSSGELAKFGLSTVEILYVLNKLKRFQKESWIHLLHFHVGSQASSLKELTDLKSLKALAYFRPLTQDDKNGQL
jgi:arginine decarboxylase